MHTVVTQLRHRLPGHRYMYSITVAFRAQNSVKKHLQATGNTGTHNLNMYVDLFIYFLNIYIELLYIYNI